MSLSLAAYQTGVARGLRGLAPCPIDAASAGFRFTVKVRRSWCEGRTMIAARAVLTLLPAAERSRLVGRYVDQGGGLETFQQIESDAFLAFLAPLLPDPSHPLSLCRMDMALAKARAGTMDVVAGNTTGRLTRGRHAELVWFHADPALVLSALSGAPVPPVGERAHPVLFAPGLANLFRLATEAEAALWAGLPTVDAPPKLAARLLAEGVLARED